MGDLKSKIGVTRLSRADSSPYKKTWRQKEMPGFDIRVLIFLFGNSPPIPNVIQKYQPITNALI